MVPCKGCTTAANPLRSVPLPGGWTVNHYGGNEGFFGWLALQPRRHADAVSDLTPSEAGALGPNLALVEHGVYRFWCTRGHKVARVYAMSFLEGQLETHTAERWHLHIHVVPRFVALHGRMWDGKKKTIDAYQIAKLGKTLPQFLDRRACERRHGKLALQWADYGIVSGVVAAGKRLRRTRTK
jgi:diadenosine tetraphosphate (Ap4A) HIT family hydrolase